jgi:hypothetical protein
MSSGSARLGRGKFGERERISSGVNKDIKKEL